MSSKRIKLWCGVYLSILMMGMATRAQPAIKNIVILYADDQRYNTVHALGNKEISTPHLDQLVARGVSFTRAFTMGGLHGALCVPSRAMLMTGRYLLGLQKAGDVIPPEHAMLPEQLRKHHYNTYGIGKWHNDKASYSRNFSGGAAIFFGGMHFPEKGGQEHPLQVDYDASGLYPSAPYKAQTYSSELYAHEAIKFLHRQVNSTTPFLLYVAFTSPHDPRTPPEAFRKLYDPKKISLPPNYLPQHPFDNGDLTVRDELLLPRPLTPHMVRQELALYYGMVSELDLQVGRIIRALDSLGLSENTLIVFAGDNGLAVGSHGLLGKQSVYEHSMRVPLILAHASLPQGLRLKQLVYLSDIAPSVYELLGQKMPPTVQSESFVRYIHQPKLPGRSQVYHGYRSLQRAVRTADDWKYIRYTVNGGETEQLFYLKKDPGEIYNLVNKPKYQHKLEELRGLLGESQRALGSQ